MLNTPLALPYALAGLATLAIIGNMIHSNRRTGHATGTQTPAVSASAALPKHVNPFRIGNLVLISEDLTRPELDWYGTILSTRGDTLTVRDNAAPYATAVVDKADAYRADAWLDRTDTGWKPTEWKRWEL